MAVYWYNCWFWNWQSEWPQKGAWHAYTRRNTTPGQWRSQYLPMSLENPQHQWLESSDQKILKAHLEVEAQRRTSLQKLCSSCSQSWTTNLHLEISLARPCSQIWFAMYCCNYHESFQGQKTIKACCGSEAVSHQKASGKTLGLLLTEGWVITLEEQINGMKLFSQTRCTLYRTRLRRHSWSIGKEGKDLKG